MSLVNSKFLHLQNSIMESRLVVFYSRTGNTRKLANILAERLNADIEEVEDTTGRSGPIGWLKAGRDAGRKSLTKLKPLSKNPADYDIVVVCSPIWNDTISTPIRTYLIERRNQIKQAALLVNGFTDDNSAITHMTEILRESPVATLRLLAKQEVESDNYMEKLEGFMKRIESRKNENK
jgi:hypothetical protein